MSPGSGLAILQVTLAVAIFGLGIPENMNAIRDLGFYSRIGPLSSFTGRHTGEPVVNLEKEIPHTGAEKRDLAFALLAQGDDPDLSDPEQIRIVKEAARGFRDHLSDVPADSQAWAGLASTEVRLGELKKGAAALRMSILTSPWSNSLVQWRCGLGIDLYRVLNEEERELMKGQFRVAAQRSAATLAQTVTARKGTRIARLFLASSPDELIKFEAEIAKRP